MFGLDGIEEVPENEESSEAQPSGGSSRLILWLVALGLGLLLMPMYLISTTIKEDNLRLQDELVALEATLQAPAPVGAEKQTLTENLSQVQSQLNALKPLESNLSSSYINWPVIMATISHYDLGLMRIDSITEQENAIVITGDSQDQEVVMSYSNRLRDSQQFERVTIQSIVTRALPTPTPVPEGETAAGDAARTRYVEFTLILALKPFQSE